MGQFAPILTLGAGIFEAREQREAGEVQEAELKREAEQERIASIDREGQRRRRLNKILGAQIAETGARGVAFEGSPQAIARGEIRQAELAEAGAKVTELSRISQLRRAGTTARIRGRKAAKVTLLKTGADVVAQTTDLLAAGKSKPSGGT